MLFITDIQVSTLVEPSIKVSEKAFNKNARLPPPYLICFTSGSQKLGSLVFTRSLCSGNSACKVVVTGLMQWTPVFSVRSHSRWCLRKLHSHLGSLMCSLIHLAPFSTTFPPPLLVAISSTRCRELCRYSAASRPTESMVWPRKVS